MCNMSRLGQTGTLKWNTSFATNWHPQRRTVMGIVPSITEEMSANVPSSDGGAAFLPKGQKTCAICVAKH